MSFFVQNSAMAQISMNSAGNTYIQDFNELPSTGTSAEIGVNATIPFGWTVERSVPGSGMFVNNGSYSTGGLYSYGHTNSTDRALGAISAAKQGEITYNLLLQNTSDQPIIALNVSYVGEQWRSGSINTGVQSLTFSYAVAESPASFDLSTRASAKGWAYVPSMQFSSPYIKKTAGHVNGNDAANRAQFSYTLPVVIPAGHYVMLRWRDADELEQDHGLAIDDVKVTWEFEQVITPLPVELTHFSAKANARTVELVWTTASEQDNSHFDVERSTDGKVFEAIGKVNGQGTTSLRTSYTFRDVQPASGTSYYRLKQVDYHGTYTYSKVEAVQMAAPVANALVYPTIVHSELRVELPQGHTTYIMAIYDKQGRSVLQQQLTSNQIHTLDVSRLRQGSYMLVLHDAKGQKQVTRFLKN